MRGTEPVADSVKTRVFSDHKQAAAFWLENRQTRSRGPSDPRRFLAPMGRSTNDLDVEATLRSIEAGLDGINTEWHAALLVHLGWRIGIRRLRDGEHLGRAGLPTNLPGGFSARGMAERGEIFRRRLAQLGVIDAEEVAAWDRVEGQANSVAPSERPMSGWKAIAEHLGVSEITAKRWEAAGLPVHRPARGTVLAFASELNNWVRSRSDRSAA